MRNFVEIEAVEGIAEDIISNWADHKQSHDYLTEVRMIDLGDTAEFLGSNGNFNVNIEAKGIDVSNTISSELITVDKGIAVGNSLVNTIEKDVKDLINASNLTGKLSNMERVLKIVIDNSVLITEDNKACLKYAVAVIY